MTAYVAGGSSIADCESPKLQGLHSKLCIADMPSRAVDRVCCIGLSQLRHLGLGGNG